MPNSPHFALKSPQFAPKCPIFDRMQNLPCRYSCDTACNPVHEEKVRIVKRCQIAPHCAPNGSFLDSCKSDHGAESSNETNHTSDGTANMPRSKKSKACRLNSKHKSMLLMKMHILVENEATIKHQRNNIKNHIYKLSKKWMHYLLMLKNADISTCQHNQLPSQTNVLCCQHLHPRVLH